MKIYLYSTITYLVQVDFDYPLGACFKQIAMQCVGIVVSSTAFWHDLWFKTEKSRIVLTGY